MARSLLIAYERSTTREGVRRGRSPGNWSETAMKYMTFTLLAVATACSSTTSTPPRATASGISSPRADFTKYQTFSFGPANPPAVGYQVTERSLEVQRRIAVLVQASLQERGYQQTADNADLVIKISTGSGMLPGDKVQRGNPAAEASAGFIGVDAYDSASGAGVWHGSAFAHIDPSRIDDALLSRGVKDMLAAFPARVQ
jgi:hypothetical protein